MAAEEMDPDIEIQLVLLAASHHDVESLRPLLRSAGSANVQDPETGFTPLHAAIAACEPSPPGTPGQAPSRSNGITQATTNGAQNSSNGHLSNSGQAPLSPQHDEIIQAAVKTVKMLLQNGAIWNDLDNNDETPGCLARRLGLTALYDIMVDAGVRAEILLNRLDGYQRLQDDAKEEEQEVDDAREGTVEAVEGLKDHEEQSTDEEAIPNTTVDVAVGPPDTGIANPNVSSEGYLRSDLTIQPDRILDQDQNGVMMAWETKIMQRTVNLLAPSPGLRVLNIGHGMGIIDNFFQAESPSIHHIIEAHPTVLAQMKDDGWYERQNVTIHSGKWQDIVPKLLDQGTLFDVIYFDTFAEDYNALRDFFSDFVVGLLEDEGKWGFFNGLGADRQICYDVYAKVVEMDLFEAGYDVEWEVVDVPDLDSQEEWRGVRRKYWAAKEYRLPVCTFIG
ncbi:Arginine N-methyltransferase 2 [Bachmanniomyces sp. S44760]|nr:Arginine N-methyltransferase 2 [Bachmanniomyces sp. S44760]